MTRASTSTSTAQRFASFLSKSTLVSSTLASSSPSCSASASIIASHCRSNINLHSSAGTARFMQFSRPLGSANPSRMLMTSSLALSPTSSSSSSPPSSPSSSTPSTPSTAATSPSSTATSPSSSSSSSFVSAAVTSAGSGTLQSLKPAAVDSYWNDIAAHFREPGFSTFEDHPQRATQAINDPEFMRKLLTVVITDRPGQGDLLPSVIAKGCCDIFTSLDRAGKTDFLKMLAKEFGSVQEDVVKAAQQYLNHSSESKALLRAQQVLRHALVPGHNRYFDKVGRLPGGLKFLIDMRTDLLDIIRTNKDDIYLPGLNESLKEKLQNWLVGFLDLERITWQSPAVLLERLTNYEAVHKFKDYLDLKRRVGPGRRVFALIYKSMPHEPLVFVQVALVNSLSANVQSILNDPSPGHANPAQTVKCAIFYSITSQQGLSGIELGNFLIKRVVRSLKVEFPQLETFSTLSPIPGLRKWIEQCQGLRQPLLLPDEAKVIQELTKATNTAGEDAEKSFEQLLKTKNLLDDTERSRALEPVLTRLCARYLLIEKRRYLALDPVANFHLRNGACMHRLNWMGDSSRKGMEESFGMMVNYLYALDEIEKNNQQYLDDGTITISSREAGQLVLGGPPEVLDDGVSLMPRAQGLDSSKLLKTEGDSMTERPGQWIIVDGVQFRRIEVKTT